MPCPHGKFKSQCSICKGPRRRKPCPTCGDEKKRPVFGKKNETARRCINCKLDDDLNLNKKMCEAPQCTKGPTFGPNGKPRVCNAHNVQGWPSITKTCGCAANKLVSFGSVVDRVMLRCGSCKQHDDINLRNKACCVCGSQKVKARYGAKGGSKRSLKCYSCKTAADVNLTVQLCIRCTDIRPSFGVIGTKKALRCYKCQLETDVEVSGRKKCIDCGALRATYGFADDRIPIHCASCADKSTECDLNKNRCVVCDEVRPSFGPVGGKALRCAADKIEGDVDLVSRLCELCPTRDDFDGHCKRALFASPDDDVLRYCSVCNKNSSSSIVKKRKAGDVEGPAAKRRVK